MARQVGNILDQVVLAMRHTTALAASELVVMLQTALLRNSTQKLARSVVAGLRALRA